MSRTEHAALLPRHIEVRPARAHAAKRWVLARPAACPRGQKNILGCHAGRPGKAALLTPGAYQVRQFSWRQRLFMPTIAASLPAGPEARQAPAWRKDSSRVAFGKNSPLDGRPIIKQAAAWQQKAQHPVGFFRHSPQPLLGHRLKKLARKGLGQVIAAPASMTHVLQTGGFQCRAGVLPAPAPCVHFALPAAHAHAAAELHSCRARGGCALRSHRCGQGRERKSETIRKSCESLSLMTSL